MVASVRKTILEAVVFGVLGIALGFGANTVRGSGSIRPLKNYFRVGERSASAAAAEAESNASAVVSPPGRGDVTTPGKARPKHPYQEVSFTDVVEIFNDPGTEMGANVFIDARAAEIFAEGHIPEALQIDHYRIEEYVGTLLDQIRCADKIIIYCNGGNCEDSIFLCADLIELDIPCDAVYLYTGGWTEWAKKGMPVAKGRGR